MKERLREQLIAILNKIEQAQQKGSPYWPLNEADTERIVIEPILNALGYEDLDYRKRLQGSGADYPDYLVLPETDQKWILEAKEWDTRLDEKCERQAVNYANNNGAQWAVLTNGRKWWIYNTRVSGDLNQQRVYVVDDIFDIDNSVDILSYLSRESILGGELERIHRMREIRDALLVELREGNKRILNAMRSVVGQVLDKNVSNDDIQAAINEIISSKLNQIVAQNTYVASIDTADEPVCVNSNGWYSLEELAANPDLCTNRKPYAIKYFDNSEVVVKSWRGAVLEIIQILLPSNLDKIKLPYKGTSGVRYFINSEPIHSDNSPMKDPKVLTINGKQIFIETNTSADRFVKLLYDLFRDLGVNPSNNVLFKIS